MPEPNAQPGESVSSKPAEPNGSPPPSRAATDHERFEEVLRERDRRLADALTELRQAQEGLRQSQKMEAIGQLAGGVAHDFNNLLTVVNGYSDILLQITSEEEPSRPALAAIKKAAEQASQLTRQLLAFSRKQVLQPQSLELNILVGETEKMLRRLIGEDIALECVLDPNLGRVKADPGQIEQVIINLAVNARDAMPQGGRLVIETANVNRDEVSALVQPGVRSGPYVMLAVSDTGCGMDETTKARIFEPFFTTKAVGKGTGLGLATVYGIVKQSEGHIEVSSVPGKGTTLRIYLPRFQGQGVEPVAPGSTSLPPHLNCLLVEDEEAVRDLIAAFLTQAGHQVEKVSNGQQALDVFRKAVDRKDPFDIVITDVVMPIVGGFEVCKEVKAVSPVTPVLAISGYDLADDLREQMDSFLPKPFTTEALLRAMAEAITACRSKETLPKRATDPVTPSEMLVEKSTRREELIDENPLPDSNGSEGGAGMEATPTDVEVRSGRIRVAEEGRRVATSLARVLIADDDPSARMFVKHIVENCECVALAVSSGEEALQVAAEFCPDTLIMDYNMPGLNGLQTIERLRSIVPESLAIMITGAPNMEITTEALRLSVFDFLRKPFSQIELEQALRRARVVNEAKQREKRQRDFLSVLSHELRSPLQAPLRYIGNLLSGVYGPLAEMQRHRIQHIAQGITTQARLVNNLLDVSHVEAGRFSVHPILYSLKAVTQDMVNSFEIQAAESNVTLLWTPSQDPFAIPIDVDYIKQALGNVLCNALQHTLATKSVEVRLSRHASMAHCTVRDEGVGIAAPHLERIFERGYQVPSVAKRHRGGLGIGLYIAREIVRAHGGDIVVASKLGQGCTFTIILTDSQEHKEDMNHAGADNHPDR